ncbi:hypothetical protein HY642_01020 [Candidatus Woesearchaeota archaeon]|nr:hypothetical protein [Candidatus Woesearchaeota archaeon]
MDIIQPGRLQPIDVDGCRQYFSHFVNDAAKSVKLRDAELREYVVTVLTDNLGDRYRDAAEQGQLFHSDGGLIQTAGILVDEAIPREGKVQRFNACYLSAEYIMFFASYFGCTRLQIEAGPHPFERFGKGTETINIEDRLCTSRRFYCAAAWLGEKFDGEEGRKARLCGRVVNNFARVADTMRMCGLRMRNYANG